MKKIILIIFYIISFPVYSVSNQEIMNTLDEIQFQQDMMMLQNLQNQTNRRQENISRQNQQNQNIGPSDSMYVGTNTNKQDYFMMMETVHKNKQGNIEFMIMTESNYPQYYENVTYYYSLGVIELRCNQRDYRYKLMGLHNKNNKSVKSINNFDKKFTPFNWLSEKYGNIVCR